MKWRCCVLSVLMLVTLAARERLAAPAPPPNADALSLFPDTIGAWVGRDAPLDQDVVKTAAVDDYLNRSYRSDKSELGLYVGYYRSQRKGEALHSPLQCLPGAGWEPLKAEPLELTSESDGGWSNTINKLVVQKGVDQMLVLYWYQTLNRVTASEYSRKLFLVSDAFRTGRTDVALVRVISPIDGRDPVGELKAMETALPFAERVLPDVHKRLFRG
jgi:EpsI family protein